jgi:hypothetical protein
MMNAIGAAGPTLWMCATMFRTRGASDRPAHHSNSPTATTTNVTRIRCAVRGSMLSVSRGFGHRRWRRGMAAAGCESAPVSTAVAAAPAPAPLTVRGARRRRDLFRWSGTARRVGVAQSSRGALDHRGRRLSRAGRLGDVPFTRECLCRLLFSRRMPGRPVGAPPLPPLVGIGRRNRRLDDRAPVEGDVGVLGFERFADARVERLAADLHIGRGSKPVENPWPNLAAPVRCRLHEIEILDAALVAREAKKRQPTSSSWARSSWASRP